MAYHLQEYCLTDNLPSTGILPHWQSTIYRNIASLTIYNLQEYCLTVNLPSTGILPHCQSTIYRNIASLTICHLQEYCLTVSLLFTTYCICVCELATHILLVCHLQYCLPSTILYHLRSTIYRNIALFVVYINKIIVLLIVYYIQEYVIVGSLPSRDITIIKCYLQI